MLFIVSVRLSRCLDSFDGSSSDMPFRPLRGKTRFQRKEGHLKVLVAESRDHEICPCQNSYSRKTKPRRLTDGTQKNEYQYLPNRKYRNVIHAYPVAVLAESSQGTIAEYELGKIP